MLKIENLSKTYAGATKPSVENISFEVKEGEIFGFIGPNGAGKSTTIKCMSGIISMSEGDVYIDGKSMRNDPIAAKRNIGYVNDDHALYEGLTGAEYINFISDVFGVSSAERERRLERYLKLFALEDVVSKQISTYSHGMKQKLNIIGALIHEPKVWILDEPMTGLDPKSAYNLKQLMREHAQKGNCVFFSSHVLEVVEKLCDKIGIIDGGHLITMCTMEELKQRNMDKSLEELFLKLTDDEFSDKFYNKEATVEDALKESGKAEDQVKIENESKSNEATAENQSEQSAEGAKILSGEKDEASSNDDAKSASPKSDSDISDEENDEKYSKNQQNLEYLSQNNKSGEAEE